MAISSEQYKTAIFEMCRRSLRVESELTRVTYYDMLYAVLEHEGVTVDAEGYDRFRVGLEGHLNYLSDNNLLTPSQIRNDTAFEEKYVEFWGAAWEGIGITSTATRYGDKYVDFAFTYPDGLSETYRVGGSETDLQCNIRFYSTLDYAQKVMPYWTITPSEDLVPLNELHRFRGSFVTNWEGEGVYWDFDKESQTIEFSGTGTLILNPNYFKGTLAANSMNLGDVLTAIYGAGVTGLPANAFNWGTAGTTRTIVCLHGATDAVTLGGTLSSLGSSSSAYILEIYCDNENIRAGTFGQYVTVNWHALSEWSG